MKLRTKIVLLYFLFASDSDLCNSKHEIEDKNCHYKNYASDSYLLHKFSLQNCRLLKNVAYQFLDKTVLSSTNEILSVITFLTNIFSFIIDWMQWHQVLGQSVALPEKMKQAR